MDEILLQLSFTLDVDLFQQLNDMIFLAVYQSLMALAWSRPLLVVGTISDSFQL